MKKYLIIFLSDDGCSYYGVEYDKSLEDLEKEYKLAENKVESLEDFVFLGHTFMNLVNHNIYRIKFVSLEDWFRSISPK